MVQGIDYTSVSPWNRLNTALGLVRVVHIRCFVVCGSVGSVDCPLIIHPWFCACPSKVRTVQS